MDYIKLVRISVMIRTVNRVNPIRFQVIKVGLVRFKKKETDPQPDPIKVRVSMVRVSQLN
jgi:hypothetical protein